MRRLALLITVLLALAAPQTARADDDPPRPPSQLIRDLKDGRISEKNVYDLLSRRGPDIATRCRMDQLDTFFRDVGDLTKHLESMKDKAPMSAMTARNLMNPVLEKCGSGYLLDRVTSLSGYCELAEARQHLERLKALAENYRRQAQALIATAEVASADVAAVKPAAAEKLAKTAAGQYEEARKIYLAKKEECEKYGDAREALPDNSAENVSYPASAPRPRSSPLVGRWTSAGGAAIETTREADGTISARIVATNQRMLNNGYTAGMQVLRGLVPKPGSSTWAASADSGEYFVAKQPDRKPGEPYGDAAWVKGALVYIESKTPDVLALPATIENRLSNYEPFRRAAPQIAPPNDPRTLAPRTPRTLDFDDFPDQPLELLLNDGKKVEFDDDRLPLEDKPLSPLPEEDPLPPLPYPVPDA